MQFQDKEEAENFVAETEARERKFNIRRKEIIGIFTEIVNEKDAYLAQVAEAASHYELDASGDNLVHKKTRKVLA